MLNEILLCSDLTFSVKDEAFELGQQWAKVYDPESISRQLISDIMNTSYLVNVVHNDFHDTDAIFKPFFQAGEEYTISRQRQQPVVNGAEH